MADLCEPRFCDGDWFKCGRTVLERNPTGAEACPSYGGGGMFICTDCADIVCDFLRRAYDARARRQEWEVEDGEFESLED